MSSNAPILSQPNAASGSYLIIYNAHNGHFVKIPKPVRFHSVATFKTFLLESFSNYLLAGTENIFLLTSFGIKFNFNMINELNEVYVYDKRLFSKPTSANDPKSNILEEYLLQNENHIPKPRRAISAHGNSAVSVKEMSENLKLFERWSKSLLEDCRQIDTEIKNSIKEINTIFKCFNIIFLFGTNFIHGIEKNFNNYFNYIKLTNMKTLHASWQQYYRNLQKNFPLFKINKEQPASIQMSALLEVEKLETSSEYISENLPKVVAKFNDMSRVINTVNEEKLDIDKMIELHRNESISRFKNHEHRTSEIMHGIINSVRGIVADIEEITHTSSSKLDGVYQKVSRVCQNELFEQANQLYSLFGELQTFRRKIAGESITIFSGIANLQMRMVNLKEELKGVTQENNDTQVKNDEKNGKELNGHKQETDVSFETINRIKKDEDYLSLTIDLPLLFGFMLIEKRRQYEWYDFYSKGVVKNISEQLSTMIEYERVFRKLWIKKFGIFLTLLSGSESDRNLLHPKLPSIDVTLVNGDMGNDEFGNILKDVQISRDDILKYIEVLKQYSNASALASPSSKNFAGILEKNFQDLVKSTNNMKKVTKLVCSISTLTSPNSDEINNSKLDNQIMAISQHGKKLGPKGERVDQDTDLNVIKGLKLQINKLENLLHQQQYKNLSQWPVTRGANINGGESNGKFGNGDSNDLAKLSLIVENSSPISRTNPTVFLQRTSSQKTSGAINREPTPPSPNSTAPKILDASTTIDKHLDNIRLRKENNELLSQNRALEAENRSNSDLIAQLQKQIRSMETKEVSLVTELETYKSDMGANQKEFKNNLLQKDETISTLQNEITKYMGMNNDKFEETVKLNKIVVSARNELSEAQGKYETLLGQFNDSNDMKSDLLSNMSAKENEFKKERNVLEDEIKSLKLKLDEVSEDYENLMELTQTKHKNNDQLIGELNFIGTQLIAKLKNALTMSYNFYYDFCLVLESMGLLLVKEYNENRKCEELKIVRVKGLRSKGKDKEKEKDKDKSTNLLDDHEILTPLRPTSKVVESATLLMEWVKKLEISTPTFEIEDSLDGEGSANGDGSSAAVEIIPSSKVVSAQASEELIKVFRDNFEGSHSKYDDIVHGLQFPPSSSNDEINSSSHTAFVAAISKRFRDVEGFAKKLTKENRSKTHEINKLSSKMSSKITMNDFQIGDLLLFLPTRIDHMSEFEESFQPWAAFNIGSPHYFLKMYSSTTDNEDKGKLLHNLKDKDWMVGRILSITSFVVGEDTTVDNPFQLSAGVSWYYVEAKEVELE